MANNFATMPVYLDTDTTKAGNTNWKGTSGGSKYCGGIGIRPEKLLLLALASTSTTLTVPGTVVVYDANNATTQPYCTFEILTTTQAPIEVDLTGAPPAWHDFIVTGLTATGTALQIYYRA